MRQIYVATYQTESGDRGIEGAWTTKPDDESLKRFFAKRHADDFDAGTINWKVVALDVRE